MQGKGWKRLELPDKDIVSSVRNGNIQVFEGLFHAYYVDLCTFANYYVSAPDIAEEIVADVFALLWERRAKWEVRTSIESYLFGAVRNRAHTANNRAKNEGKWVEEFVNAGATPALGQTSPLPGENIIHQDKDAILRSAVNLLPERSKTIFFLRWKYQKSFADIAEILGMTTEAVKKQHSRLLQGLKSNLGEFLD